MNSRTSGSRLQFQLPPRGILHFITIATTTTITFYILHFTLLYFTFVIVIVSVSINIDITYYKFVISHYTLHVLNFERFNV